VNLFHLPIINARNQDRNESINQTRWTRNWNKVGGIALAPLTIVLFGNLDTSTKIKLLIKMTYENYIEELAEYQILDESKYDIEQPSILKKMNYRLKIISKRKYISRFIKSKIIRFC
jgi:hypothetical protein